MPFPIDPPQFLPIGFPMYQLVSQRRFDGELVIELRKRFDEAMVIPAILFGVAMFFLLLFLPPLLLIGLVLGGLYVYYILHGRLLLCYDAGTLRVVRNCDFSFYQWRRQAIYDRADVPPPVTWVRVVRSDKKKASFHLEGYKVRQYQTRFPFAAEQNLGVICVHDFEQNMRQLQQVVADFFAETPYDRSQFARTEAVVTSPSAARNVEKKREKKQVRNEQREEKRRASRFDETKRYTFDRGDAPIRRGDETAGRHARDEMKAKRKAAKSRQTHRKDYQLRHRSMVKVEEEISASLRSGNLTFVSTTPSLFSNVMATLSILLYRLMLWGLILGGPALMIAHYSRGPAINRHVVPKLENLIVTHVPEENRELFDDALREYAKANGKEGENLNVVCLILYGWCALLLCFLILSRIVRWPFWGRWTVKMHHTDMRPYEILFTSRTDRVHCKEPSKGFVIFFRIIPATPKTNRLLTGRPFCLGNSGWKRPRQAVFITDNGSFALPCGSVDEQEQIIKRVRRFVDGVMKNE